MATMKEQPATPAAREEAVRIPDGRVQLDGSLTIPDACDGLVIFAHGSGSSRFSPRNRRVAQALQASGFATLLLDLLTRQEEAVDLYTREIRFDIERLGRRVIAAADWAAAHPELRDVTVGYFGASTGAAAALIAAAARAKSTAAVVSRGGRPDLAGDALPLVQAPTLLIVGGDDEAVIELNEAARRRMKAVVRLEIVPGASHLFEEPGALEEVERLAADWFRRYLPRVRRAGAIDLLDGIGPAED
jgi:putative phosphoribosyl transferase